MHFFSADSSSPLLGRKKINIDYTLLMILLVPVVLLLSNDEWLFPYGNATDAWLNNSYFYGYGKDLSLFASYKVARLSWILKGYVFHHLFSPLVAYYSLNLIMLYTIIITFYFIAKLLYNKPVAFLSTLALATYTQMHSVNGFEWDYHTHDSLANFLLTL